MSNICELFPIQTVMDFIPIHESLQKHKCSAAPFSSICPLDSFSTCQKTIKPSCLSNLPLFPIQKHNAYQSLTFTLFNFVLPQTSFFQKKKNAGREGRGNVQSNDLLKGDREDRELYMYKAPTLSQKMRPSSTPTEKYSLVWKKQCAPNCIISTCLYDYGWVMNSR